CNGGTAQAVNIKLNTPIPLTWVRLVFREPGLLDQVQLTYEDSNGAGPSPCDPERRARVDPRTVDIMCPTETPVAAVSVGGAGVAALCSLDISAGTCTASKHSVGLWRQTFKHSVGLWRQTFKHSVGLWRQT
ncbi:hypothetical protein EGW08_008013, partial [Elysia chlorotica]